MKDLNIGLIGYGFIHADFMHLLFNMLMLWMFGAEVERAWGTVKFLKYYFICGVGAGICVVGEPQVQLIRRK